MKTVDREKLWEEYQKKKTPELREKLIIEYSPLVKLVAGRLSMYLGYNVEYDDLVSYGIFGLIDAIDKFDLVGAYRLFDLRQYGGAYRVVDRRFRNQEIDRVDA